MLIATQLAQAATDISDSFGEVAAYTWADSDVLAPPAVPSSVGCWADGDGPHSVAAGLSQLVARLSVGWLGCYDHEIDIPAPMCPQYASSGALDSTRKGWTVG